MRKIASCMGLALLTVVAEGRAAEDISDRIGAFLQSKVREWVSDPVVVNTLRAQNQQHLALSMADITRLDNEWKEEAPNGSGKLVSAVADNDLSEYLRKVKTDNSSVVTEIIVMDNRGLNVGLAELTSDYWQGDEAKWQKTFSVGANGLFIDEPKFDESSGATQVQASMTIMDPKTQEAIGAVTVGVNVKGLP